MYVFGNGESRLAVDIDKLAGIKVGCNAIARTHTVDHLICVDRRMMNEALNNGVNVSTRLYTRSEWYNNYKDFLHVRKVPDLPYKGEQRWDEPFHWGSGPYAVLLAAEMSKQDPIKLLGFDLYSKTDKINNVYKNTDNYDSADKRPIDPRYWIHQIGMVFKCFHDTPFIVYQESDWQIPRAWIAPNVTVDNISNIPYNSNN